MPCYDSRDSPSYVREETRKESQAYIDKLTRMLCEAMKIVHNFELDGGRVVSKSVELNEWWKHHQIVDRQRRKK